MIYIKDNFLDPDLFSYIKDYIKKSKWKTITIGPEDSFNFDIKYIEPEQKFVKYIQAWLQVIERADVNILRSFFRKSNSKYDTEWRIHNDSLVDGVKPDRALVFYINKNKEKHQNGTAFWKHHEHGCELNDYDIEEFNRLLIEDSNDLNKWTLDTVVNHKENRLVSYPCNYFHSKYPDKAKNRTVFVAFYTSKQ
jgi:hypothetical protein